MRQHVVIRREEFVGGTREKPEVGVFTQTHANRPPVPWGRIGVGEVVWMKWTGGPLVAQAIVSGFRQIENATPETLKDTTRGFALHELETYWLNLPPVFYGVTIYLEKERWVDEPISPSARSRGESWIVLDTPEKADAWLTNATVSEVTTNDTQSKRTRRSRTLPHSVRFHVLRRDNFQCTYCGGKPPEVRLQVDHIQPRSRGGTHDITNLRAACSECNIGKGARSIE